MIQIGFDGPTILYFTPDTLPYQYRQKHLNELARHGFRILAVYYRTMEEADLRVCIDGILEREEEIDVVMLDTNTRIPDDLVFTLEKSYDPVVVQFWVDQRGEPPEEIVRRIDAIDVLLMTSEDQSQREYFESKGVDFHWHYGIHDSEIFRPILGVEKNFDVGFAGNNLGERHPNSKARNDMLEAVRSLFTLRLIGRGWLHMDETAEHIGDYTLVNREFQKCRMLLSISNYNDIQKYTSDRTGNCMLSGRPTLVQYFPGIEEMYDMDAIVVFREKKDLLTKIGGLLRDTELRAKVGRAGRADVMRKYDFPQWAESVAGIIRRKLQCRPR